MFFDPNDSNIMLNFPVGYTGDPSAYVHNLGETVISELSKRIQNANTLFDIAQFADRSSKSVALDLILIPYFAGDVSAETFSRNMFRINGSSPWIQNADLFLSNEVAHYNAADLNLNMNLNAPVESAFPNAPKGPALMRHFATTIVHELWHYLSGYYGDPDRPMGYHLIEYIEGTEAAIGPGAAATRGQVLRMVPYELAGKELARRFEKYGVPRNAIQGSMYTFKTALEDNSINGPSANWRYIDWEAKNSSGPLTAGSATIPTEIHDFEVDYVIQYRDALINALKDQDLFPSAATP